MKGKSLNDDNRASLDNISSSINSRKKINPLISIKFVRSTFVLEEKIHLLNAWDKSRKNIKSSWMSELINKYTEKYYNIRH